MVKRLFAALKRGEGKILVACYESHVVAIEAFWADRFGCDGDDEESSVGPWNADLFFCGDFDSAWSERKVWRRLTSSLDQWFPLVLSGESAEFARATLPEALSGCFKVRTVAREASGSYVDVKLH